MLKSRSVSILPLLLATAVFSIECGAAGPSIVENSPFLPPNFQPPGAGRTSTAAQAAASAEYEFRGVYMLEGEYHFNLFNKREQKGTWVGEDDLIDGAPRIVRYSREDNEVIIDLSGRQLTLGMISTSDKVLPVQTAKAPTVRQPSSTSSATTRTTQAPVRRRVIRPSTRTTSSSTPSTIRRPTIQRPGSQRPATPSSGSQSDPGPIPPSIRRLQNESLQNSDSQNSILPGNNTRGSQR